MDDFSVYGTSFDNCLYNLLQKDVPFVFYEDCKEAFEILKKALISAPIVQPPDQNLPFEIMCDASDYAIGAVLGQRIDKKLNVIHYASKTLDSAQKNYATTEKRSEERRVGKECRIGCRSRWSPYH